MNNKVIAVVQARMSSSRLPGKPLLKIAGVPSILHTLRRVASSEIIEDVVMATSTKSEDDDLVRLVADAGFSTFRGSLQNVLERTLLAARHSGADHVVRVPGDKPLVDSAEITRVVKHHLAEDYDYCSNFTLTHPVNRNIPLGLEVEVFRLDAIERAVTSRIVGPEDEEHVTSVFYNNPTVFRIGSTLSHQFEDYSRFRVNLDAPEDYEFFLRAASEVGLALSSLEFLEWLGKNPAIQQINASVSQAPLPR